mgnify:CR=1 FL=1
MSIIKNNKISIQYSLKDKKMIIKIELEHEASKNIQLIR